MNDPHANQPLQTAGILSLADAIPVAGLAWLAPQAANGT